MAARSENTAGQGGSPPSGIARFYAKRQRVTMALLLFVVVVGLPMVGVPKLRQRLSARAHMLENAAAGTLRFTITERVGANTQPFPSEYEKPKPALAQNYPQLPQPQPRIYTTPRVYAPEPGKQTSPTVVIRSPGAAEGSPGEAPNAPESQVSEATGSDPKYNRGEIERQAYDILLSSNPAVSGMVGGSNPALQFKAWDAAKREEDLYWVRLTFLSVSDRENVEYIWQVKPSSKHVTPLSHNARTLQ